MRGISKMLACFFGGMLLLNGALIPENSWAQVSDQFLKEAQTLAKLEDAYFNKRLKNDLKGAYEFQHPVYKEKISLEEFLYFEGRLVTNYRNGTAAHISGGMIPSLDFIKKHSTKKDVLGFPRPYHFKWYPNPHVIVQRYTLEQISISEDGKYAMVEVMLKGRERLNPALVRGDIAFDMARRHVDYWEKVDGKWAITVLVDQSSISGGIKIRYFIPNNNDAWEKKNYIHIDSASLLANPDPVRHALNGKH
jgi:hypothetical protein